MTIGLRRALYFAHSVGARYKVSPAPSSAAECRYIHDCFSKIGTVDFFRIESPKHTAANLHGQQLSVVVSPLLQLEPFAPPESVSKEILESRQRQIKAALAHLCALPRYSYVAHNEPFFRDEVAIPFKHVLDAKSKLLRNYTLTLSTGSSPFVTGGAKQMRDARHNFQKFHKFEVDFVKTGVRGVAMAADADFPHWADKGAVDESLFDLGHEIDVPVEKAPRMYRRRSPKLKGFFV